MDEIETKDFGDKVRVIIRRLDVDVEISADDARVLAAKLCRDANLADAKKADRARQAKEDEINF